jgi:hypothetical protein
MVTDADFGYPAYRGFVEWAFKQAEFRAEFTAATGIPFPKSATTTLERMIDEAVGLDFAVAEAFMLWVSEAHWGLEHCPPEVKEAIVNRRK